MEPLYKTYILNQSHALEHYHRLSQTFQFDVYFPLSQILAHKASNAWDLPSLLIKPVQRLLHYPQLLAAIIAEMPDSHGDKANLIEAHARIGELARDLNAQWGQQEVVREVLANAGTIDASWAASVQQTQKSKFSKSRGTKSKNYNFSATNDIMGIVMLVIRGAKNLPKLKNSASRIFPFICLFCVVSGFQS